MNGRAIPGVYLFRLYVCDKEMSWSHHIRETHQPTGLFTFETARSETPDNLWEITFRLRNVIPQRIIFCVFSLKSPCSLTFKSPVINPHPPVKTFPFCPWSGVPCFTIYSNYIRENTKHIFCHEDVMCLLWGMKWMCVETYVSELNCLRVIKALNYPCGLYCYSLSSWTQ
jgi:hypothetical protein